MCLSISVLSSVSMNVQFSCIENDLGLRDRYAQLPKEYHLTMQRNGEAFVRQWETWT